MKRWLLVYFGYPIGLFLSRIMPGFGKRYEQWFIRLNNKLFNKYIQKKSAVRKQNLSRNVLLILPHCLQFDDCENRITKNVSNCKQCGKCNIGDIMKFNKEYGIIIKVATGGRLAKRIINDLKPEYAIAVACERELLDGISAIYPLHVFAVQNTRPSGPCINTRMDITELDGILKKMM